MDPADNDLILNVQGDEPEISAAVLDRLIDYMDRAANDRLSSLSADRLDRASPALPGRSHRCRIGTLAAPFADDGPREGPGSPLDPDCVKVVVDAGGRALYFSRSPVPYPRGTGGVVDRPSRWLLHLGVYAFRADTLRIITGFGSICPAARRMTRPTPAGRGLPRSTLEEAESLEQLRWLEHGLPIAVVTVEHRFVGIDTPEDYAAFVERAVGAVENSGYEVTTS